MHKLDDNHEKKPAGIELKVPSLPSLEAHFAMKVASNKI